MKKLTFSDIQSQSKTGIMVPMTGSDLNRREEKISRKNQDPLYIHKASFQGLLNDVENLLLQDAKNITIQDFNGWNSLHHAAAGGKTKIIDLLLNTGADIDAEDYKGNTALHVAAKNGQVDSAQHLLVKGIKPNSLNSENNSALHAAVYENRPQVIEMMGHFLDVVDINIRGKNGVSPLHVAAKLDRLECARILMSCGAKICQVCNIGFYPVHLAAKNGSAGTLEAILEKGMSQGCTFTEILSYSDMEDNSPLHSAVNYGDYEVVKMCIKYGAHIDAKQKDEATAFHLACSQGSPSIVELMFDHNKKINPDSAKTILHDRDILGMTPLHRAAMFDHADVVTYLIKLGSDVNTCDNEHRSPLLLAAISGGCRTLTVLLNAGADLQARDNENKNLLHYIVFYGKQQFAGKMPCCISDVVSQRKEIKGLLNQRDSTGCTPLHLASKHGNLVLLEMLLRLGATVNLRNDEEQSPLHFAARYGRVNTVHKLLTSSNGQIIINEIDGIGMTALHIASANGHVKVVQQFLKKGAILHRDFQGRSPLHLASENGYTETMSLLLSYHSNLLDQKDSQSCTALHYAAIANQPSAVTLLLTAGCRYDENDAHKNPLDICTENHNVEAALSIINHERWRECLGMWTYSAEKGYTCPLAGLIQYLPGVHKALLDRCYTVSGEDPNSKNYWVQFLKEKYNFEYMEATRPEIKQWKVSIIQGINEASRPLYILNTMVQCGRVELLSHPVCLQYLYMKWCAYGFWVYFLNLLLYMLFVGSLTGMIVSFGDFNFQRQLVSDNTSMGTEIFTSHKHPGGWQVPLILMFIFLLFNLMKEILQMYQQGWLYITDVENYIEWALYISTLIFVSPIIFFNMISKFQWQFATVAIFLAWFNLLMYLQRMQDIGIYVVMFLQILSTILNVLLVFSVLFVAFGLAFYILLAQHYTGGFQTPFISSIRGLMMMMGDWDFVATFVPLDLLSYPVLSFTFLILFVILMPILFINLLIGLAVGDIEMVQKDAQMKRLAMQVEYHTKVEERLPNWILDKVDKREIILKPNSTSGGGIAKGLLKIKTLFNNRNHSTNKYSSRQVRNETTNDTLFSELSKTKKRIKEMQNQMDKQFKMIKLIVQKMEIVSEADQYDEGFQAAGDVRMSAQDIDMPVPEEWDASDSSHKENQQRKVSANSRTSLKFHGVKPKISISSISGDLLTGAPVQK